MGRESEENIRAEIVEIKKIPVLERSTEVWRRLNDSEAELGIRRQTPGFTMEIIRQMQSMSLKPKTKCRIHYWQNMNVSEVFEFEQDTVLITNFLQWIRVKFSRVIPFSRRFTVFYLSDREGWDKRIKIEDSEALRSYLMLVSRDRSQQSYIIVSTEQTSPTKPPCTEVSTKPSSTVSSLTDHSRGSVQGDFNRRVLTRDGNCCVFCGDCDKAHLSAAHLFDVFRAADIPADDAAFLHEYELIERYSTLNGITLCSDCHNAFDALLCCVKIEFDSQRRVIGHKIVVANALKSSAEFVGKWSQLDGANVRVPTDPLFLRHWAHAELFEFRAAKYDEYTLKRRQLAQDLANVCKCGSITESMAALANHIRSKSCLEWITNLSNKFAELHTPAKKKKRSKRMKSKSAAGNGLISAESK